MKQSLIDKYLVGETSIMEELELKRLLQTKSATDRSKIENSVLVLLSDKIEETDEEDIFTADHTEEFDYIVKELEQKERVTLIGKALKNRPKDVRGKPKIFSILWKYTSVAVALVAVLSMVYVYIINIDRQQVACVATKTVDMTRKAEPAKQQTINLKTVETTLYRNGLQPAPSKKMFRHKVKSNPKANKVVETIVSTTQLNIDNNVATIKDPTVNDEQTIERRNRVSNEVDKLFAAADFKDSF